MTVRRFAGPYRLLLLLLVLVSGLHLPAAQAQVIPRIAEADSMLEAGLRAYQAERWTDARQIFERIDQEFPRNATSSTARLMAAKAAFRNGDAADVRSLLSGFAVDFPGSSYADEARALEQAAMDVARQPVQNPITLGVLLSLAENERIPSQQLFNGIRMAVDAHNQDPRNRPVRMIFRDIAGDAQESARAVSELKREGADAIIGTLFSDRAVAAAERADQEQIVFMAPMATDEQVSEGRRYAFQANPTMTARGRAMARFAINGLRLDSLGVIAVADDRRIGERLADGFIQGASELGAKLNLVWVMDDDSGWYSLPDTLTADTLRYVDAVYVPMASGNNAQRAGNILGTFDRLGGQARLLGNAAWHDLPQKSHASKYMMTYGNDFFPDLDSEEFLQFGWGYYDLSGEDVGRLGISGHDVTRFLLAAISREDSRSLEDRIRNMAEWQGYGIRIHFNGSNGNQALTYHRYRDGLLTRIR